MIWDIMRFIWPFGVVGGIVGLIGYLIFGGDRNENLWVSRGVILGVFVGGLMFFNNDKSSVNIIDNRVTNKEFENDTSKENVHFVEKVAEHDFLVAVFMNPEADYGDFYMLGMTKNNTTIQSADFYISKKKIKEFFKSDTEFYTFYNNVKIAYNYFITDNTEGRHLVEFPYNSRDISAPPNALRGNAYQRNFCFANFPTRLHYKPIYSNSSSNEELKDRIEDLERQLIQKE